jgi:hypothetical protein
MKSKTSRQRDKVPRRGKTTTQAQLQGTPARNSTKRPIAKMPHERDESARDTGNRMRESMPPPGGEIRQAYRDIEHGLSDTDRRGVPDDIPSSRDNRGG